MKPSTPATPPNGSGAGGNLARPNTDETKEEEINRDLSSPDWLLGVTSQRYPTLTDEEFATLFHIYKTSPDPAARTHAENRIILPHVRLILHWAHKNTRSNVRLLDFVQEGYFGARRALQKFEPQRKVKFVTYANSWIRQAMQRYRQNTRKTVRVPVHLQAAESAIIATTVRFHTEHGRLPDETEIYQAPPPAGRKALAARFTETMIRELWKEGLLPYEQSLDAPIWNESRVGGTLHQILPDPQDSPEATAVRNQDTTLLHAALAAYARRPGAERSVALLRAYYLDEEGITFQELGDRYGISRERVRKVMNTAMIQLRRITAGLLRARDLPRPGVPLISPSIRQQKIFVREQHVDPPQDGVLLFEGERWLNRLAIKRILGVDYSTLAHAAENVPIRVIRYRPTNKAGLPAFYAERDLQLVQDERAQSRQHNPPTKRRQANGTKHA